ncbi:MAG: Excinuclease ABC C subunit domain protein [Microgenomates group bacterium GW2011_GWA1_48_10]|nr:MAG: Excinuclease ABC C subunit domain protein [Microgenomates group bacterium GW2011_GWA1_48_10]
MPYHYVYVLRSGEDGTNYVGCTNNLKRRLDEHSSGKSFSTRNKRPLQLIYSEIYLNQQDAFTREKFLKSGWGKNYIRRILQNWFRSKNLGG